MARTVPDLVVTACTLVDQLQNLHPPVLTHLIEPHISLRNGLNLAGLESQHQHDVTTVHHLGEYHALLLYQGLLVAFALLGSEYFEVLLDRLEEQGTPESSIVPDPGVDELPVQDLTLPFRGLHRELGEDYLQDPSDTEHILLSVALIYIGMYLLEQELDH